MRLSAEARHNLFLVAKEALNNVAKHARASEVRIKLDVSDGELCLSMEDAARRLKDDGLLPVKSEQADSFESRKGQPLRVVLILPP